MNPPPPPRSLVLGRAYNSLLPSNACRVPRDYRESRGAGISFPFRARGNIGRFRKGQTRLERYANERRSLVRAAPE